MIRIALITSAIVLATVSGGIGLSLAHSSTQKIDVRIHDRFTPEATFAVVTLRSVNSEFGLALQEIPAPLARENYVSLTPRLNDAPRAEPNWEVSQNAIEPNGFGTLLAPLARVRPNERPLDEVSAEHNVRPLVISSPIISSPVMTRHVTPRRSTPIEPASVRIEAAGPTGTRMDKSPSATYLIGVYR